MEIELGRTVQDRITGFKGIATGRAEYLTGCRQYLIEGKAKDGDTKAHWVDDSRIVVVETHETGVEVEDFRELGNAADEEETGGPQPHAPVR